MASPNNSPQRNQGQEPWWHRAYAEVFALEELPAKGSQLTAKRPTLEALAAAVKMLRVLKDLPDFGMLAAPRVVPTLDQGIQFEWHCGPRELEVELNPSGREIEFLTVDERGLRQEGRVPVDDLSDVRSLLRWLIQ